MKLKLKDKLKIIELYNEGRSIFQISKQFKIYNWVIENIGRQYREHGIEAFKEKGKSSKTILEDNVKYPNVNQMIKLCESNISCNDKCMTIPYYLAFLIK